MPILNSKTFQESLFKIFHYNKRSIRKVKSLQKLSNKEIYFILQNNNENYNKPFKFITWTNAFNEHSVITPDTWGKIFTDWFKKCGDGYIFSIWYKFIHFSLSLNPALHRMGTNPYSLCPRCKGREESHPLSFLTVDCQITLDFINKLINLNHTFRTPFKISIKEISMLTSSHTHDGIKLEILQTLTAVFLRHVTFRRRKAFYGDGYDKIQELSNFKGNLVSHFKKLRAMSVELGSKESFLRK